MCKREELVQCIGKLHEELVENVDAREKIPFEPPGPRVKNNCELYTIVDELVEALRQLKLLDAAPCATTSEAMKACIMVEEFDKLSSHDFTILAVLDEIRNSLKDRELLMAEVNRVREHGIEVWRSGYEAALRQYAHWKDGVQYVGSCGKTLKQVLEEVDAAAERADELGGT